MQNDKLIEPLIGRPCTLNNQAAKITRSADGRQFLRVCTLDPEGPEAIFAWKTVLNVVTNHGGKFNT